jgi:peptidoglycan/LPS O-acetylase OafA/YrhL
VQVLVGVSLLLAVPPVARVVRRHPFGAPLALALVGLALRFELLGLPLPDPQDIRPHGVLWLFALGWAGAQARDVRARLLVSGLLLVGLPGFFDEPYRDVVVAIGVLAVLWVPVVRLPRTVVRPVAHLAAASLAIYLTHWQVYPPVRDALGPWPAYGASLLAGMAIWVLATALARRVARAARGRRPAGQPAGGPGKADAGVPA